MTSVRVELPLTANSKILSKFNTIGDLKKAYPKIEFIKYIYVDPKDNVMKGVNPPNDLPVVSNAYITVIGDTDDVIQFVKDATD